ncbi:TPA_asm: hypothetical protein [ssRNA phage Gerhypos.4_3]|uniref:Transmembrane protein n=2 Tax=Leviviricetes TaxID=2842243 RepID=A0A8S5KYD3_9VIRU|nr:hypothetical protein QIP48_gp4 [ssRNA phage Gerhypos.4_3]QDH90452.1 MAG: hypothetical protein H4Bulk46231_000003 [Leviviridae sp.]DAD50195.1 TPA_asm: hypothetical protein [ssRNA phage Gerhypos.4_3]
MPRPSRSSSRSDRRAALGGRRKTDQDPRTTLGRKTVTVIVFLVNFVYLVVDALFNVNCQSMLGHL